MPTLIFPISADGLCLPALVSPGTTQMQAIQAAGLPIPAPLHVRAMLDTGSDLTAVVPRILTALGASPSGSAQTRTASGSVNVQFYKIGLSLYDPAGPSALSLFRTSWTVTSLQYDLPDVEVLIGMDLISELVLGVDGPARQFTLTF
jgi:hypothetical protein